MHVNPKIIGMSEKKPGGCLSGAAKMLGEVVDVNRFVVGVNEKP